ncbi:thioredoxin [Haladaptatus sp. W1]|uniref:thioredoxin family protein n=1 Tax=Haladaptatus sp. W1 TaxID=1897478 RepID=UPI0008498922|nr:thioredoxin family protein [Haladaptatus sp. W1]ODR79689.1 thioredoxin [Haladaptatus sp. W1]
MSETSSPDALFDVLVDEGVVIENGTVALTDDFEHRWSIYYDTYASITPEAFAESIAETFHISRDEALDSGVTRAGFSYYLALRAHLDGEYTEAELGRMSEMVAEVGPSSPVPDGVNHLTDETYRDFLETHPACIVSVWKRDCEPCEAVAAKLPELRAGIPDDVAFAGIDGDDVVAFRREFEVTEVPSFLCFRDGECRETVTGAIGTDALVESLREVYD